MSKLEDPYTNALKNGAITLETEIRLTCVWIFCQNM